MRDYINKAYSIIDKLSNEQVRQFLDSVKAEYETLDTILESLSVAIIAVDAQWQVIRSNSLAKRYFSHANDTYCPKVFDIIKDTAISGFLHDCFASGTSNIQKEFPLPLPNESTRYVIVTILSVYATKNEGTPTFPAFLIKIQDITEAKKQEVLLRRAMSMASLTNVAANMAHDIKNPLGAISIHAQLVEKALAKMRATSSFPPKKELEEHITIVNNEIERLNTLVEDFLSAVRPINAKLAPCDIVPILKNMATFYAVEFNNDDIAFELVEKSVCDKVMLDETLFRKCIANIIENARHAVKDGSTRQGKVIITVLQKAGNVVVKICDNGIGMEDNTRQHVFEPYFTTRAKGTGLGLATVYKIMQEHGGEVAVTSELGKGTTFTLKFPVFQKMRLLE